jgi:acetyl-CoA acetyltransferase
MCAMEIMERRTALTGIGQSEVGRRLNRDPLSLTADACLAAIADAGLEVADIDGLSTYPGGMMPAAAGFTGAGVTEVQEMLRLELNWFCGGPELPGQLGAVINACAAVATGLARHVLCFRTVWESTAQGGGRRQGIGAGGGGRFRASGFMQWTLPYGAASAAVWIAMMAQRHFHEFGTTREQMAWIALNARRNAQLNPKAIYRDPLALTADACLEAIEDAGLTREDIDGLSTYPGMMAGAPGGFS